MQKIALILLFLITNAANAGGRWIADNEPDEMTGKAIKHMRVASKNEIVLPSQYAAMPHALLMIVDHPRRSLSIMLSLSTAQFVCRRDGCSLLARFDDGETETVKAFLPDDGGASVVILGGTDTLLRKIQASKRLRIEAAFYSVGSRVLDFDVTGLDWSKLRPLGSEEDEAKRLVACTLHPKAKKLQGDAWIKFHEECLRATTIPPP